jgi:hypothetical protein
MAMQGLSSLHAGKEFLGMQKNLDLNISSESRSLKTYRRMRGLTIIDAQHIREEPKPLLLRPWQDLQMLVPHRTPALKSTIVDHKIALSKTT